MWTECVLIQDSPLTYLVSVEQRLPHPQRPSSAVLLLLVILIALVLVLVINVVLHLLNFPLGGDMERVREDVVGCNGHFREG